MRVLSSGRDDSDFSLDDVSDLTPIRRKSNLADPLGMRHGIKYGGVLRRKAPGGKYACSRRKQSGASEK
jgi:hypothetical protein